MDAIHPDLQAGLRKAPTFVLSRGNRHLYRLALRLVPRPSAREVRVTTRRTPHARLRVYTPTEPGEAALLWIHGGGLVIGHPRQDDARCIDLARALGIRVFSAHYRLAPEHPFPAGLDDCHAAWCQLVGDAARQYNIDPTRIALVGESAGGNLATTLVQRLVDEGGAMPTALLLVYPMLDDRTATRRDIAPKGHRVWCNQSNHFGWSSYLHQPPGLAEVPSYAVAARRENPGGLPPTWIGVGTADLFCEENARFAERLVDAGVDCTLNIVDGAYHGFVAIDPSAPISQQFFQEQIEFLATRLGVNVRPSSRNGVAITAAR